MELWRSYGVDKRLDPPQKVWIDRAIWQRTGACTTWKMTEFSPDSSSYEALTSASQSPPMGKDPANLSTSLATQWLSPRHHPHVRSRPSSQSYLPELRARGLFAG